MDKPHLPGVSESGGSAVVRPMVRYVDESQAVVEVQVALPSGPADSHRDEPPLTEPMQLFIQIVGTDGFLDEQAMPLRLRQQALQYRGAARFEMVSPERWWPAGMGEQVLYELTVTLHQSGRLMGEHHTILGLTSVRTWAKQGDDPSGQQPMEEATFIVNGELCRIDSIVAVDQSDESKMLPVAGNSLLVVRDHYGTDLLYDAADRAGILAVQCVPIDPAGDPQRDVAEQVARLSAHPSLAGWYVGHMGSLTDRLAAHLAQLDPTHAVFRRMPGDAA